MLSLKKLILILLVSTVTIAHAERTNQNDIYKSCPALKAITDQMLTTGKAIAEAEGKSAEKLTAAKSNMTKLQADYNREVTRCSKKPAKK